MPAAVVILASKTSHVPDAVRREIEAFGLPVVVPANSSTAYAAAVRSGFAQANQLGCTHAITLDIDMGHAPADVPAFVDATMQNPEALITGVRKLPPGRLPWPVQIGTTFCDFWIWTAAGRWTHDCGHAYRAYPLAAIDDLVLRSIGYEFELEILVKSIWSNVKTVHLPVHIPINGGITFIGPRAFVRFGWLITMLIFQRLLLPAPMLSSMHRGEFGGLPLSKRLAVIIKQTILHHCDRPASFGAAAGLGVFFGIAPIWGLQMLVAAMVAHVLGLSKAVMAAASNISFPLTIPFILYASLIVGHVLRRGEFASMPRLSELDKSVVLRYLGDYVLGSIVLGMAMGSVVGLLAYVSAKGVKCRRERAAGVER